MKLSYAESKLDKERRSVGDVAKCCHAFASKHVARTINLSVINTGLSHVIVPVAHMIFCDLFSSASERTRCNFPAALYHQDIRGY